MQAHLLPTIRGCHNMWEIEYIEFDFIFTLLASQEGKIEKHLISSFRHIIDQSPLAFGRFRVKVPVESKTPSCGVLFVDLL